MKAASPIIALTQKCSTHAPITATSASGQPRGSGGGPTSNQTNAPPSEDPLAPVPSAPAYRISLEEQSAFVIQQFALAFAGEATGGINQVILASSRRRGVETQKRTVRGGAGAEFEVRERIVANDMQWRRGRGRADADFDAGSCAVQAVDAAQN